MAATRPQTEGKNRIKGFLDNIYVAKVDEVLQRARFSRLEKLPGGDYFHEPLSTYFENDGPVYARNNGNTIEVVALQEGRGFEAARWWIVDEEIGNTARYDLREMEGMLEGVGVMKLLLKHSDFDEMLG
jgi:hypothetical protein